MEEQLKEKEAIEAENAATNAKLMENEAQVSAHCYYLQGTSLVTATIPLHLSCSRADSFSATTCSSCLQSCGPLSSGMSYMDADACLTGQREGAAGCA